MFSHHDHSTDHSCLNKKGPGNCELRQVCFKLHRPRPTAGSINHGLFQHEISEVCTQKFLRFAETVAASLYFEASRMGLAVTQQSGFQLASPPRRECKSIAFSPAWDYLQGYDLLSFLSSWEQLARLSCKSTMEMNLQWTQQWTQQVWLMTQTEKFHAAATLTSGLYTLSGDFVNFWVELGCWESSLDRPDS